MRTLALPASMRVLERGWLSSNCVLISNDDADDDETVLVDTGYGSHAAQTVALVGHALRSAGRQRLDRIVNTHLHSDHCGGNAALKKAYDCRITIPAGYAAAVRNWDGDALMFESTGQECERFDFDTTIAAGDILIWGGLAWRALAAPGHDDDSLIFFCERAGILISADALWEDGFGALFPEQNRPLGFAAAGATLDLIASLAVQLVIPGHGAPFDDVSGALQRAKSRLDHLSAEPMRNARHVAKVLLKFKLLEAQRMPLKSVENLFHDVPILALLNDAMGCEPAEFAHTTASSLVRVGAARFEDDVLVDAG